MPEGRLVVAASNAAGSTAGAGFGVLGFLGSLTTTVPFFLITLLLVGAMVPWVRYHDEVFETVEQFMRGVAFPVYRDTLRPIVDLLRQLYNPLSCWVSGVGWFAYGVVQTVILPTVVECGPGPLFANAGRFIFAVLNDFLVDYFFAQQFYYGPADFTNICDKWIALFESWIALYSCLCSDFAQILRVLPIVPSVLFSEQWTDPQTWCVVSNATNAAMELLAIALRLIEQVIQAILFLIAPQSPFAQVNFTRPDFYQMAELLCRAAICFVRSFENAIQRFWDAFVPFPFVFSNYFSILDTAACLGFKTANWVLTIVINVDKVIAYPADPFWDTVMRPLTIENLNLIAAPSNWQQVQAPPLPATPVLFLNNFFLDTSAEFKLNGDPNPVFGRRRLTEGLCIFISRSVCDPTDANTACFSGSASSLLSGLDFCCLTDTVLVIVVDLITSLYETTYHFTSGATNFFLYLDNQPFTTVLVDSITPLARCITGILTLIPVVGTALQNVLTEAVCYIASILDFAFRAVFGLVTLPYFLIEIPGTDNFLTMTGRSIDLWVSIQQKLIEEVPGSLLNSLCLVLNTGFPIPPIPCSDCDLVGFIPLPDDKKRRRMFRNTETGRLDSPWTLAAEAMGWENPESAYLVTPLISYRTPANESQWNPFFLAKMITVSSQNMSRNGYLPFPDHASVNRFVDEKKQLVLSRWNQDKLCRDLKLEEARLKVEKPFQYHYYKQQGRYDCKQGETYAQIREHRLALNTDAHSNLPRHSREPIFFTDIAIHNESERLDNGLLEPIINGCSDPIPPCFDLCCIIRSILKTLVHAAEFIARFFNGFVQFEKERYGSQADFPYFTGEFCEPQFNRDCFESDLVKLVLLFFQNFSCLCRFINLIVPITDGNPREDLCCAIQRASELIACIIQVLINAITALALGGTNEFAYYTDGLFFDDVSALFDVTLEVVYCLCTLIRGIFPLNFIPGFRESVRFDPCCIPERLAVTLVESVRLLVLTVISLATITVNDDSFCYFRLDTTNGCSGFLDEIGIVKQFDVIMMSILPTSDSGRPGSCKDNCGKDQGRNGIVPCICEIFNTIIPWRGDPSKPVSCEAGNLNCQRVDLCCFFIQTGFALEQSLRFLSRLLVAFWQPWTPLPEFVIHFIFCDETAGLVPCGAANNPCAFEGVMAPTPSCNCGTFTCGKIAPIINSLTDATDGLISRCVCELIRLLDDLLVLVFEAVGSGWRGCFCGEGKGILRSLPLVLDKVLNAIVGFTRKFPLPCYWSPSGITYVALNGVSQVNVSISDRCTPMVDPGCQCIFEARELTSVENSWIFSFLGPTINAICIAVGNLTCFVNAIFFINMSCDETARSFLGSTTRWAFQLPLLIISTIEGFIKQFTDPPPTCVGSDPTCDPESQNEYSGINDRALAKQLIALFGWAIDSTLGDSRVACSRICPNGIVSDQTCICYDRSPVTRGRDINGNSVWVKKTNSSGQNFCEYEGLVSGVVTDTLAAVVGYNNVNGRGAFFDVCSAIDDYVPASRLYPGSCAMNGICRPDSLPRCDLPDGIGDSDSSFSFAGPIDGILNGLIRYFGCAIGGSLQANPLKPLLILNSFLWQLFGAIIRFNVSLIIFILSFLSPSGDCDCWEFPDPLQGDGLVKYDRGNGLGVGFCYQCPDANAMCGPGPEGAPLVCEPHCPVFGYTIPDCVSQLMNTSNPDNWPDPDPTRLCNGDAFDTNDDASRTICGVYTQSICIPPYCQAGGSGNIDFPGARGRDRNCGSLAGSLSGPKVLCSILALVQGFLDVIKAFTEFFSTLIIIPDQKKRDMPSSNGEYAGKRDNYVRKDREAFRRQIGMSNSQLKERHMAVLAKRQSNNTKKEHMMGHTLEDNTVTVDGVVRKYPGSPEMLLIAMYDYDTDDCYDDPVACACRNYDMRAHCTWSLQFGVKPAPISSAARKRHSLQSRNVEKKPVPRNVTTGYGSLNTGEDCVYPEEVMSVLRDRFNGQTPCDRTVCNCADEMWGDMRHSEKEMWTSCVDKRIQGDRVSEMSNGQVPEDIMYHTQAPLLFFENFMRKQKERVQRKERHIQARTRRKRGIVNKHFPDFHAQMVERRVNAIKYLEKQQGISRYDPMFEAYLDLDQIVLKWKIGYYGFLVNQTFDTLATGDWHFPSPTESLRELHFASHSLSDIIWNQPYREMWHETKKSYNMIRDFSADVIDTGVFTYIRKMRDAVDTGYRKRVERNRPRRELILRQFRQTPLYQWWSLPASEDKGFLSPFMKHLQKLVAGYRANWKKNTFNFWSADLHARGKVTSVLDSIQEPQWKPEQLENWKRLGRTYYRLYDSVWPGELNQTMRERFLFDGNCLVLTRTLDLSLRVLDYCANVNARNFPMIAKKIGLDTYLERTSPHRPYFHNADNMKRYVYESRVPDDPNAFLTPRFQSPPWSMPSQRNMERSTFKRANFEVTSGPARFNFLAWVTGLVEDIASYMLNTNVESWVDVARDWIQNPNTSRADRPDVGLRYWIVRLVSCEFPDDINCSAGIGLGSAILWVSVGFLGLFIIGAVLIPPLLWPFAIIPAPLVWLALVGLIGLDYSPRCMILTPSLTTVSFALPLCLFDEIIALADRFITTCYVPLIIPTCMVAGEACPADPTQFIDIVNCQLVGISDGLQHILFIAYIAFGETWVNIVTYAANIIAFIIPGAPDYVGLTFDGFRNAFDTMRCRQWWCFGLTAPALALPVLIAALAAIACGFIFPVLISLISSLWSLFEASPYSAALPGYETNWEEEPVEVNTPVDRPEPPQARIDDIESFIQKRQK